MFICLDNSNFYQMVISVKAGFVLTKDQNEGIFFFFFKNDSLILKERTI